MEMRKVNKSLELTQDESESVSQLVIPATRYGESSFYDAFALRGIRLDRVESGVLVVCSFKVPPRLTDRSGNLANGAIANLVDIVGAAVAYVPGLSMNVSVDISISYMSTAKLHDELEITSRMVGRVGGCSGTIVILRNKTTGEIIAEGRHSLFRSHVGPIPKLDTGGVQVLQADKALTQLKSRNNLDDVIFKFMNVFTFF
ncbi:acyl-coenzyme A thioesterase 13-like isoform X1 [Prunus dulcis]|nr:acyl-coenzyme A thioesterase 13-like isoform X1 [Prunus dulcis]